MWNRHNSGVDFVKLEFEVASNFGQEEHIEKVMVEESGMLLWAEIPQSRLEIEEQCEAFDGEVDATNSEAAKDTEFEPLGPFWNAELKFKAFVATVRGLEPNSAYSFRIAVANEVGWSEKSEVRGAHTVYRPVVPSLLEAQRGPFEIRVFWDQPDPVGGLINAWEAQVCEASLFSSWSEAKDFVILRHPEGIAESIAPAFINWEAAFGCLKPNVEYMLRLRTGNIAGWSNWSETLKASTCGPPCISKCTLMQTFAPGNWIVHISLKEPCKALLCAVDLEWETLDGNASKVTRVSKTVARQLKNGQFRAEFVDVVPPGRKRKASAQVAVCNVAGWSKAFLVTSGDHDDVFAVDPPAPIANAEEAVPEILNCLKSFLASEGQLLSATAACGWEIGGRGEFVRNPWFCGNIIISIYLHT